MFRLWIGGPSESWPTSSWRVRLHLPWRGTKILSKTSPSGSSTQSPSCQTSWVRTSQTLYSNYWSRIPGRDSVRLLRSQYPEKMAKSAIGAFLTICFFFQEAEWRTPSRSAATASSTPSIGTICSARTFRPPSFPRFTRPRTCPTSARSSPTWMRSTVPVWRRPTSRRSSAATPTWRRPSSSPRTMWWPRRCSGRVRTKSPVPPTWWDASCR